MNHSSSAQGNKSLPPHIQALIGHVPLAGTGVHRWLFICALKLHGQFSPDEIVRILRSAVMNCGRFVPDSEIVDAVKNSAPGTVVMNPSTKHESENKAWPKIDHAAVQRVVSSIDAPLARLVKAANWSGLPNTRPERVSAIAGILFRDNPLVCAGPSVESMRCQHVSVWGAGLSSTELIVPSPMTARTGVNQAGGTSNRCLRNTGPRRFLVVEFDSLTIEEQAAIHMHLAARYPLALVVHSGGKSLHGWYYVAGRPEHEVLGFMRYAVCLGADPHTWTRCQAVRTPGGLRRDGGELRVQYPVFFNPNYGG